MKGDDRKPPLRRRTAAEEHQPTDDDDLERKRREADDLIQSMRQASRDVGNEGRPVEFGFSYIGMRAPTDLKLRLEAAARKNGRSLSSECQFRLECSFRDEAAFGQAIALLLNTVEGEFPAERVAAWLKTQFDKLKIDGGEF